MDLPSIATAATTQTLALFVLGAPYGVWLTKVRRWVKAPTQMSPDTASV
ncbi:hypothetical protein JCM19232_1749 [Vibrio ishigakensis]|uniref:Uncharacterized protein n=1 Tax=Vibrio ishigakensis TaxID=1481914 RepID=A0A0B8PDB1_9VIBR|nr:hypothetical protein JCM19232_1749 [Vibrio ishigakensis]